MDLNINKGIVKKSEGETVDSPFVLKDLKSGEEYPLSELAMKIHELREGDIVEFSGRISGNAIFLAIACVDQRICAN